VILDNLGAVNAGSVRFDPLAKECARLAHDRGLIAGYSTMEHGGGLLRLQQADGD
jgi:hypothetical protein